MDKIAQPNMTWFLAEFSHTLKASKYHHNKAPKNSGENLTYEEKPLQHEGRRKLLKNQLQNVSQSIARGK